MKPSKEISNSGRAARAGKVAIERGQSGPGAAYTYPVRRLLFIGKAAGGPPRPGLIIPPSTGLDASMPPS